jgi:hypothetical protein
MEIAARWVENCLDEWDRPEESDLKKRFSEMAGLL